VAGIVPITIESSRFGIVLRGIRVGLQVIDATFSAGPIPTASSVDGYSEQLTHREQQVLEMMAEGLSNKEVSSRLAISTHTVKFHISSILGKLGAGSRTEAVSIGVRTGRLTI
jgi:DNA-binding NarL/FixJ family response regulator